MQLPSEQSVGPKHAAPSLVPPMHAPRQRFSTHRLPLTAPGQTDPSVAVFEAVIEKSSIIPTSWPFGPVIDQKSKPSIARAVELPSNVPDFQPNASSIMSTISSPILLRPSRPSGHSIRLT